MNISNDFQHVELMIPTFEFQVSSLALERVDGPVGDDGNPLAISTIIIACTPAVILCIRWANLGYVARRQDDPLVAPPRGVVRHAQRVRMLPALLDLSRSP